MNLQTDVIKVDAHAASHRICEPLARLDTAAVLSPRR